jgi:hypothetical protein
VNHGMSVAGQCRQRNRPAEENMGFIVSGGIRYCRSRWWR